MKNFILLVVLAFTIFGNVYGQTKKTIKLGIVNGRATYLPIPEYPKEAKDFCVSGKVEVEVLISENGNVVKAKAIFGDELLRDSVVKAVKKAKFRQIAFGKTVKTKGIVVYNFVPENNCLVVGIVNDKALFLPKPQIPNLNHPKHFQIKEEQIVTVQIVIDESGKVVRARAILGHSLLRAACEKAARQATFSPSFINGSTINIKALLVYKFKPDGTIDTKIESDDEDVVNKPINLVKPSLTSCNCKFSSNPSVIIVAEIDEQGNVIKATAVSGHPVLKLASEKAALESKFLPSNTKVKIFITYDFVEVDKWSVKSSSIEIKNVRNIRFSN